MSVDKSVYLYMLTDTLHTLAYVYIHPFIHFYPKLTNLNCLHCAITSFHLFKKTVIKIVAKILYNKRRCSNYRNHISWGQLFNK